MTAIFRLVDILDTRNVLGECALWNARMQCLWWTDINGCRLFRYDPATGALSHFATPDRLCSFAFAAGGDRLIAAFSAGVALYDPQSGLAEWLFRLENAAPGLRFNDGRTDRQGRFWTGTMVEGGETALGRLYCVAAGGQMQEYGGDRVTILNSLCVSPDGGTLYFADSARQTIFVCDLDVQSGRLTHQRVFAQTGGDVEPDGATVDVEGCLWCAHWRGGCVVRYAPDGRVLTRLALPVALPTSVAFGGPGMNLLFVTSARDGLREDALLRQPQAGNLFVYETDVMGLADAEYA